MNGTYVNGHRVLREEELKSGDQIVIGDISLTFLDRSQGGLRIALEQVGMLLAGGESVDRREALRLLEEVIDAAGLLGATGLAERAIALKFAALGIAPSELGTSVGMLAATVHMQRPDLKRFSGADGTVTILLTDIEDSTLLTIRLGDEAWMKFLQSHHALIRRQVQSHDGFEVKGLGDGFMIAFRDASSGLKCAVGIQRAVALYNEKHSDLGVRVRIGLHTGEALWEQDDLFGKSVIIATRVASTARGGEILVSSLVKTLTEGTTSINFGERREVELKGLPGKHEVFAVVW